MHRPEPADTKKYTKALGAMYGHSWLFPDHSDLKDAKGQLVAPPLSSEDYLGHFAARQPLLMMRVTVPYIQGFLEKNKDKVVFSSQISSESMVMPYTVLQWDRRLHVICDWVWSHEDERFLFPTSVFCDNPRSFLNIIADHKEFEFHGEERSGGLGFHVPKK